MNSLNNTTSFSQLPSDSYWTTNYSQVDRKSEILELELTDGSKIIRKFNFDNVVELHESNDFIGDVHTVMTYKENGKITEYDVKCSASSLMSMFDIKFKRFAEHVIKNNLMTGE